jgi:hypothetical protein
MLRECAGRCRPVERLVLAAGIEIAAVGGLKRGTYYVLRDRVIFLVPDWARGPNMREAEIARQLVLATLGGLDPALVRQRVCATVAALTGPYLEELAS